MHLASHPAPARIVGRYREARRDAAMYPAIHSGLARARVADVHLRAHRDALAGAARQARPLRNLATTRGTHA